MLIRVTARAHTTYCSPGDRKIKGAARWLYFVYHRKYVYFPGSDVTYRSNKMASSKNARKIILPSFRNALSFASGDFYGGSTTFRALRLVTIRAASWATKWLTHGTSAVRNTTSGVTFTALVRFAPSGGKVNPLGYIAYRLGCHGLTYTYTAGSQDCNSDLLVDS